MDNIQKLSDLNVLMLDELPGIDPYTLAQHVQQASRKFCDDTEAWIETLAAIDLVEDQTLYTLTPSWDCRIKRVTEVWLRSDDDVDNDLEGVQQPESYYKFVKPNSLVLAVDIKPSADVTDGLMAEVVLVPEITQTGTNVISLEFLNDYAEGIMERAYYTLKMMPKQRWSDSTKAMNIHMPNYLAAVTDAMGDISMMGKTQPDGFSG